MTSSSSPHHQAPPAPAGSNWIRRIGCISTSRADAGIYRPLLAALAARKDRAVSCFAGGTHLDQQFGRTIDTFSGLAGIKVVPVEHFVPGDRPVDIAATAGQATERFAKAFEAVAPDLVFVLGDRTEMLAATLAAVIQRIPIAHLHGGDLTEGAYDDQCRNAITKLAHVHFPALREHAERITAMGEEPWRVMPVGALALDAIREFAPESVDAISKAFGIAFGQGVVVVAYHPETLCEESAQRQIDEVLAAVDPLDADILLIGPNADAGHEAVREALAAMARSRPGTVLAPTLSQTRFWSVLTHAAVLVGNSSAGILEAASFGLPVVNVGDRQKGRVRARNVLDTPRRRDAIGAALQQALDPDFRENLVGVTNPYGDGLAAERIVGALHNLPDRQTLLRKCSGPR
jgi:UDP-hydrolysing UDP-N-acetyl-D-glucosamine 2-epimerase